MVFAINPPADGPKSFEEFKKLAIAINGTATYAPPPAAPTYEAHIYAAETNNYDAPESTWTPPSSHPVDHKITGEV
jgi:hypothetical protein